MLALLAKGPEFERQYHINQAWWIHNNNTGTQEVEAGESEVCSHPWLCREFEVSLGYRRPSLKNW